MRLSHFGLPVAFFAHLLIGRDQRMLHRSDRRCSTAGCSSRFVQLFAGHHRLVLGQTGQSTGTTAQIGPTTARCLIGECSGRSSLQIHRLRLTFVVRIAFETHRSGIQLAAGLIFVRNEDETAQNRLVRVSQSNEIIGQVGAAERITFHLFE